jgi:hypothetical protein
MLLVSSIQIIYCLILFCVVQLNSDAELETSKAFFNTIDWWAFAPPGPFLCPTTEDKKWPVAPKPGPWDLY